MRILAWWRHLALAALVAGLISALALQPPPGWAAATAAAALLLALSRPGAGRGAEGRAAAAWLALLAAAATLAGLGLGALRLEALAGRAASAPEPVGSAVLATGYVAAQPRQSFGELRFPLDTDQGRLLVVARSEQAPGLGIGDRIEARGQLTEPEDWRAAELRRLGAALELHAGELDALPGGRAGLDGLLDRARGRAERAVAAGLDPSQEALARGFVLGQDDRIDEPTRERFRRSGLAHLLAVSGQNVMLLAILGGVLLALAGVGPRARLLGILLLIAAYVPLAGAGPSIQRAGVMGAAGILAGLLGRPVDRAYLPLLAAAATLLLNPLAASEVGWQLSFVAVIGIVLWASSIRELLAPRLVAARLPDRLAAPLAEGAALTLAATVATAPLMALHFEQVSLAALPANLLVLPAVAPVMWLGMLAALLGQLPWLSAAPPGLIEGPLLDYIAWIADRFSRPRWAVVVTSAPSPGVVAAIYAALLGGVAATAAALRRRRSVGIAQPLRVALALGVTLLGAGFVLTANASPGTPPVAEGSLRVTAIDVGQGDAILLDGPGSPAVLIDTGPPGAGIADSLRAHGVESLAAVLISHDQLDHAGGLREVLRSFEVQRVVLGRPAVEAASGAGAAGVRVDHASEGDELHFGPLRLQVLSPRLTEIPSEDLNLDSLVIAARFGAWSVLLPGDAEAETARIEPGPFDVLKLAHHGSADAGLGPLLDSSAPRVALIGVGEDNPHGHPTAEALAELAARGVCILRTDLDGDVWAELGPEGLAAGSERGQLEGRPGC